MLVSVFFLSEQGWYLFVWVYMFLHVYMCDTHTCDLCAHIYTYAFKGQKSTLGTAT